MSFLGLYVTVLLVFGFYERGGSRGVGLFVTCWLNLDPKPEDSHEHGPADVQVDTLTYPQDGAQTFKAKPQTPNP